MTFTKKIITYVTVYVLANVISIVKKNQNFMEKGSKSGLSNFLDPF